MPRYGRGGYSTGDRLMIAGDALGDFGEMLGRYAYMQMQMKNIEDDNARAAAQADLDREKMKLDAVLAEQRVGETMFGGAQARGYASEDEQAQIGMKMGLGPVQRTPGLATQEEALSFEEQKAYRRQKAETFAQNMIPLDTEVNAARKLKATEAEDTYRKQQQISTDQAIRQSKALKDYEVSLKKKLAQEHGLTAEETKQWVFNNEIPKDLGDSDALRIYQDYELGVANAGFAINLDLQTKMQELTKLKADPKSKAIDITNKQIEVDNATGLSNTWKEIGVDMFPAARKLKERLIKSGLMPEKGGPSQEGDIDLLNKNMMKQQYLKKKALEPSPAENALGNVGINPGGFNLNYDLGT